MAAICKMRASNFLACFTMNDGWIRPKHRVGVRWHLPKCEQRSASYLKLMSKYLHRQRGSVVILAGFLILGIALQLVGPQILRYFIDTAMAQKPLEALTLAAVFYIVVAILGQLISVLTTYISEKIGWTATNSLREDLLWHCLRLDMAFHKEHLPGEMIERIDGDTTALSNLFTKFTITVLANLLLVLGMLVLLFREDVLVGLGMGLFAVIALLVLLKVQALAVPHWVNVRKIRAEFYGFLGEHLASVDEISANGAIPYVMNRFYRTLQHWLPFAVKASLAGYSMWMAAIFVFSLGYALAFGISGYLWAKGRITLGTAYLIFTYTSLLSGPIEQVRIQLEDLQRANASIRRIKELLSITPALKDGDGPPLPDGTFALSVENISFSYAEDQQVLDHVSLSLEPGRVLGVLGRTGGGKTTLSRLLNRFYDPDEGRIVLGGQDLRSIPFYSLREKVAYVTQDVQLLKASIRDNLTFFDSSIEDGKLVAALESVGMGEWFRSLPDGLDTQLASEGSGLSAGQSQLLALARVFLRSPGFVILDEASSRLDPISEAHMEGAMDLLLKGRTALIIAHRIATLDRADDILILSHGRVLEYGPRKLLASDQESNYARLLREGMEDMLA